MSRNKRPIVSAVIPTTGRKELSQAIRSARRQVGDFEIEIVVVDDSTSGIELPKAVRAQVDQVVRTSGHTGGSNARNVGISSANGDFVALLDDDDQWLPNKTALQLEAIGASTSPHLVLAGGRHIHVDAKTGCRSGAGPRRLIQEDEPVEHYLFRGRAPHGGRASLYTSTLLLSRSTAIAVEWNVNLRRHQDWDWVVRLGRHAGVTIVQVPLAIALIQTGTPGSISASADWRASLNWALDSFGEDQRTMADFLSAQTLRYALQAASGLGVRETVRAIVRTRRVPKLGPLIVGAAGILPRRTIERLTAMTTRSL